jgi:hypothetical protein
MLRLPSLRRSMRPFKIDPDMQGWRTELEEPLPVVTRRELRLRLGLEDDPAADAAISVAVPDAEVTMTPRRGRSRARAASLPSGRIGETEVVAA